MPVLVLYRPASHSLDPIPAGWALDQIVGLDKEYPGFLRFMFQASPLRRQGVFFALAHLESSSCDWALRAMSLVAQPKSRAPSGLTSMGAVTHYLCALRVRRIIQAIHCACPSGLIGALAKIGPDPLPPEQYRFMHRVLHDPAEVARGAMLRSSLQVTSQSLDVLAQIPADLLHPTIMSFCSRPVVIPHINAAIAFAETMNPDVERDEIIGSLANMTEKGLVGFIENWMDSSKRLVRAVPRLASDRLRCLETAASLRDASKRYRNCLKHKVGEVALDHAIFFELAVEEPKTGAIAEVTPLSGGKFLLKGIHGYANERPPKDAVVAIRDEMTKAGVLVPAWTEHDDARFSVRQTLRVWEFQDHGTLDARECVANDSVPDDMPTRFDPEAAGLVRVA